MPVAPFPKFAANVSAERQRKADNKSGNPKQKMKRMGRNPGGCLISTGETTRLTAVFCGTKRNDFRQCLKKI
jgi:hypothetical protein